MKKIVDLYHGDVINDFTKLKDNVEFVIHKATQGQSFIDTKVKARIAGFEEYNIPYWLYVYLNKGSELTQTKYMVSQFKSVVGKNFVGYCLDIEAGNSASNCQKALDYLQSLNVKSMVYFMDSEYSKYKTLTGNNTAIWIARYGANNGNVPSSKYYPNKCDLWQYTSNGNCPGVSNDCDLSTLNGNRNIAWFITPLEKDQDVKSVFTKPTSENTTTLKKYFTGRKYIWNESNFEKIAKENMENSEYQKALFNLIKEEKLLKPKYIEKEG